MLDLSNDPKTGTTTVKTGSFDNVYSAGKLSVTKEVEGNMGDSDTYFEITVALKGEAGKTYSDAGYAVTGGSYNENLPEGATVDATSIKVGESKTFHLKKDDTITISNLPYGVTYTVNEADYASAGYTSEITYSDDTNKKIDSEADTVTVTNTKNVTVDMGVSLDSLPYILALAVAFCGAVVLFTRKRHIEE